MHHMARRYELLGALMDLERLNLPSKGINQYVDYVVETKLGPQMVLAHTDEVVPLPNYLQGEILEDHSHFHPVDADKKRKIDPTTQAVYLRKAEEGDQWNITIDRRLGQTGIDTEIIMPFSQSA